MRRLLRLLALVAILAPATAFAQGDAPAQPGGIKGDMLFWITDAENKLAELAEAMPEGKYAWAPGKDVRTAGQVFMHVATANYGIPSMWGVKPPEGYDFRTYEGSLTKKADIQKALKESFAHVKTSLAAATDADFEKPVELFGMKTTVRGCYMLLVSHAHEHLGQSIAYARMNEIAPPWTERQNAMIEKKKKEAEAAAKK